jgi:EAL domain-containing protein (putative c-di-GMP-specific phosphodiesterase class I)
LARQNLRVAFSKDRVKIVQASVGEIRLVAIGVNAAPSGGGTPLRWAEADAESIFLALTDEETGTVDKALSVLVVGEAATAANAKKLLRETMLDCQPDDVLLVYFAGHGYQVESGSRDVFLVTSDFDQDSILENPDSALHVSYLAKRIFLNDDCKAGRTILVLDCCHAGGFSVAGETANLYERSQGSHQALLACAENQTTRESDDLRHGVFTDAILRALSGQGQTDQRGEVTLGAVRYFFEQERHLQPISLGRDDGPLVLTRPGVQINASAVPGPRGITTSFWESSQVQSTLDPYEAFLQRLEEEVLLGRRAHSNIERALAAVRAMAGADSAILLRRVAPESGRLVAQVGSQVSIDATLWAALAEKLGHALKGGQGRRFGDASIERLTGAESVMMTAFVIPVDVSVKGFDCLVVVFRSEPESTALTDEAAAILRGAFAGVLRSAPGDAIPALESALDGLWKKFRGRPPSVFVRRRTSLVIDRLADVDVHFEPTIFLAQSNAFMRIDRWEALARRQGETSAPVEQFRIAKDWGIGLIEHVDLALARRALVAYEREAKEFTERFDSSPGGVAVNVNPTTLMSSRFPDEVKDVLDELRIPPELVAFEISEGQSEQTSGRADYLGESAFRDRLQTLHSRLGVKFAIDDFGTGFSSFERLTDLPITYVKVDPSLLMRQHAPEEIGVLGMYVQDKSSEYTLVFEGIDADVRKLQSLKSLFHSAGVRYIQARDYGPAMPNLYRLSDDQKQRIASDLSR